MSRPGKSEKKICLCNGVTQSSIEAAITRGCDTLGKIFDATQAGVGACGGSCQPTLRKMLETYKATGSFPAAPHPPSRARRDPALKAARAVTVVVADAAPEAASDMQTSNKKNT